MDDAFLQNVLTGLGKPQKELSPKYFYDQNGSRLFERICELPEYYLTRTELSIMSTRSAEISRAVGPRCMVIELGSGNSPKSRRFLDILEDPVAYIPVDICFEHLEMSSDKLDELYPGLEVLPVCADFGQPFELPAPRRKTARTVVFFPGSTIGNLDPTEAVRLLENVCEVCDSRGAAVIGIDLQKDRAVLEAAYNDSKGITAEFNLNILKRINAELGADFRLDQFSHQAEFNGRHSRIEMYLVSLADQRIDIAGVEVSLAAGERILTEKSYKYRLDGFGRLARSAGLGLVESWTDEREYFAITYLEPI